MENLELSNQPQLLTINIAHISNNILLKKKQATRTNKEEEKMDINNNRNKQTNDLQE